MSVPPASHSGAQVEGVAVQRAHHHPCRRPVRRPVGRPGAGTPRRCARSEPSRSRNTATCSPSTAYVRPSPTGISSTEPRSRRRSSHRHLGQRQQWQRRAELAFGSPAFGRPATDRGRRRRTSACSRPVRSAMPVGVVDHDGADPFDADARHRTVGAFQPVGVLAVVLQEPAGQRDHRRRGRRRWRAGRPCGCARPPRRRRRSPTGRRRPRRRRGPCTTPPRSCADTR